MSRTPRHTSGRMRSIDEHQHETRFFGSSPLCFLGCVLSENYSLLSMTARVNMKKDAPYTSQIHADTSKKPLVTFCLFTYNHERWIRQAVEGALAQTYSPLEIIFSDDCSSDKTFRIIEELSKQYRGPHKIVLNRNEHNMGILPHFNKLVSLATGNLLVCAAGDDISVPERVSTLANAWIKHEMKPLVICSGVAFLTGKNKKRGTWKPNQCGLETVSRAEFLRNTPCFGASAAYAARLFHLYPVPSNRALSEDNLYFARAYLAGDLLWLQDVLVHYRLGGISSKNSMSFMWFQTQNTFFTPLYRQLLKDIDHLISSGTATYHDEKVVVRQRLHSELIKARMLKAHTWQTRKRYYRLLKRSALFLKHDWFWRSLCFPLFIARPMINLVRLYKPFAYRIKIQTRPARYRFYAMFGKVKKLNPDISPPY